MKICDLKQLALPLVLATGLGVATYFVTSRGTQPEADTTLAALSNVPVLELPAAAAALVKNARADARPAVVAEVIRNAVALDRGCSLPYLVVAICQQSPEMAADAVVAAAKIQPVDTLATLKAAVKAAPGQAEAIVEAFAREFPEIYPTAAVLAAEQLPDRSQAILQTIGRAVPALNPFVEQTLASQGTAPIDMLKALGQVEQMAATAAKAQAADTRSQEVKTAVAAQPASALGASQNQFPTLEQFARAEIARAESAVAATPANISSRSTAARPAPRLVAPATLRTPTPAELKAESDDLGIRNSRVYSRP